MANAVVTAANKRRAQKLWAQGLTSRAIAQELQVNRRHIWRLLDQLHLPEDAWDGTIELADARCSCGLLLPCHHEPMTILRSNGYIEGKAE